MAGECQKLKFYRRQMKMSQKEFAQLVGVSQYTICKLEKSEDAWAVAADKTIDKIYAVYEGNMMSHQPSRKEVKEIMDDIKADEPLIEPGALELLGSGKKETKKADIEVDVTNGLSVDDKALKKLINVAHAGMNGANNHEEFKSYVKLLKKLLK